MFKSLLTLLLLLPIAATADTFYVEQSRPGSAASTTFERLVKNELMARGHSVVGNNVKSQWVLVPDTIELGKSYILSLTKLKDGTVVYADKLKSSSLDDLDTVSERLVSGVLENTPSANTITVDAVTKNEEERATVKTKVKKQMYLGFGPSKSLSLGTSNSGVAFTAGALWNVDHQFSVRAGYSTSNVSNSLADMTAVSLGGHYYLDRKKHSRYAVGMLGYTWAESHGRVSKSGWGIEAGAGMHFYRTASMNIAAELTYHQAAFKIADGAPGSLGAKLIVLW